MSTTFVQDLATLEGILKVDLLTTAAKPVLSFLANVAANPSVPNVMAQWIVLQAALLGVLPSLESTVITQLANFLAAKITSAQTPAVS